MQKFKIQLPTAFLNIKVTKKTLDDCKLYLEVQNDTIRYTNAFIGARANIKTELPEGIEKFQIHLQQLKKLVKSKEKLVTLNVEYTKGEEKALVTLESGKSAEIDVFVNRVYKPIDDILKTDLKEHQWVKFSPKVLELRNKDYQNKFLKVKVYSYFADIFVEDELFYSAEGAYQCEKSYEYSVKLENFLALLNADEEILFGMDSKPVYRWRKGIFDIVEMANFI